MPQLNEDWDAIRAALANEEALRDRAVEAIGINRTFLAITNPSNAQLAAQVTALTRQNIGIIRLVLGQLDGTE